jgi:hypothetical protein
MPESPPVVLPGPIVALTQVRMRRSTGRAYYDRKIAEGKTRNEAMRCLKRRLADHVWRIMIADWNVPDFIDTGLGCQVGEFPES